MTKKEERDRLEREAILAASALHGQEYIWQEEWEKAPNPFIAIKQWIANRERRMEYIRPWLEAKNKLEKFKDRS
jgi:hypothetical protein